MTKRHEVKPGDCVSSIAYQNGFAPDTVWKHDANASLREQRASMYVLMPGDVVVIPDRTAKTESCASGRRHVFRRVGVPEKLRVRFLDGAEKPRSGIAYSFEAGGVSRDGTTDADGFVDEFIPPDLDAARITLHAESGDEPYDLSLGRLTPSDDLAGAQARLAHLGYPCTDPPGEPGVSTRSALRSFQRDQGLEATGELDAATDAALRAQHGG